MLRWLSMTLMRSLATVVMMVEPPGLPRTKRSLPGAQSVAALAPETAGFSTASSLREASGRDDRFLALQTVGSLTMVGVMEDRGRLPGAMALAGPWMRPKPLGTPCLEAKSSISSLRRKPRGETVMPEPKPKFRV